MRNLEKSIKLESGKCYTRRELMSAFSFDALKENSFQWELGKQLKAGKLIKTGYNEYRLPNEVSMTIYLPHYSEMVENVISYLSDTYPHVQFSVFETILMNEFLNHLIAQNTIFVQVEKNSSSFVFRSLQEAGYKNVMYKPSMKELNFYWAKDCIIVSDMVSEAPLSRYNPHFIMLEKMLVDMYCDKFVTWTYSTAEFSNVLAQALEKYLIDIAKMLRYARRRNKENELRNIIAKIV